MTSRPEVEPYNIIFNCINVSKGQYHDRVLLFYKSTFSFRHEHCNHAVFT